MATTKTSAPKTAGKTASANAKTRAPKITVASPLAAAKAKFGDKAGLVAAVEKFTSEDLWVGRTNQDKGLAHVSNAKLLRLHTIFSEVKDKFGTRASLIDAILDVEKRTKDDGYKARLTKFPVPRLWDQYKSAAKRVKAATAPVKKSAPKDPNAPKVAAVKGAKTLKKGTAKKAAAKPAPVKKTPAQVKSAAAKKKRQAR